MKTIYKYPLTKGGMVDFKEADEEIEIPQSDTPHRYLHVGRDTQGQMCVWILLEQQSPDELAGVKRKVRIAIRGTGHACDDVEFWPHIGTVTDGPYVWHVFGSPTGAP